MVNPELKKELAAALKEMFGILRYRLLGPHKAPKAIALAYKDPHVSDSIEKHYLDGLKWSGNSLPSEADNSAIKRIEEVAERYVSALEEKSEADLMKILTDHLDDAVLGSKLSGMSVREFWGTEKGQAILADLTTEITEQFNKIKKGADLIVNQELHNAQNFGAVDGILSVSKKAGIEDPLIYKLLIRDEKTCLEENETILMANGQEMRVGDLSIGDKIKSHYATSASTGLSTVQNLEIIDKECISVQFDDGTSMTCTKDHPVLILMNGYYLFWEIGHIPENYYDSIEIVNIHKLSTKQRKRLSHQVRGCYWKTSLKDEKLKGLDLWEITQAIRGDVLQKKLSQKTIMEIMHEYLHKGTHSPNFLRLLTNVIVLQFMLDPHLSGFVRKSPTGRLSVHLPNPRLRAAQGVWRVNDNKRIEQVLHENKDEIIALFSSGLSIKQIKKVLGLSIDPGRIAAIVQQLDSYDHLRRKQKANGGREMWRRIKKDPLRFKEAQERAAAHFLRSAQLGSRPQQDLANMLRANGYNVQYNVQLQDTNMRVDMIINENLVIEFDGSGHDLQVRLGQCTPGEFRRKDFARDVTCKQRGYKVLRIKSKRDTLPDFEALKECIEKLKTTESLQYWELCL